MQPARTNISSISPGNLTGGFIDIILLKIISQGDCYGYSISKTISNITSQAWELKEASLYSGLRRLEADKLIRSYWGDETQGGRRKYYTLTPNGETCLAENLEKWAKTKNLVDKILAWEGRAI